MISNLDLFNEWESPDFHITAASLALKYNLLEAVVWSRLYKGFEEKYPGEKLD